MSSTLLHGDCRVVMKTLADNSVDSIVTDPPYELGFMGKGWDKSGIANDPDMWAEALRVLKPGGHLLAFSGSRTYHRMVCAIEDAGFEIRDQVMWVYGSGFPKSLDVSKAMDKAAGAEREFKGVRPIAYADSDCWGEPSRGAGGQHGRYSELGAQEGRIVTAPATDLARQWEGWGTALKPAHEPIVVARKPLDGTVAANVAKWGTGALNIAQCRVAGTEDTGRPQGKDIRGGNWSGNGGRSELTTGGGTGRWPANLIHDGSDEVLDLFAQFGEKTSGKPGIKRGGNNGAAYGAESRAPGTQMGGFGDTGTAARFFYCAKASKKDRGEGNTHPTVKPTALMAYLCRLVTPPGGTILDPFMGSGSTGRGAALGGFSFIGIELSDEYLAIAERRIAAA